VQPSPEPMLAWLRGVAVHLPRAAPAPPDDPFADPFGRRPGPRLGPVLSRDDLDPAARPSGHGAAIAFLEGVLRAARADANPFLADADELAELHFDGVVDAVSW
jgi:hypothetical protein